MNYAKITIEAEVSFAELALMLNAEAGANLIAALLDAQSNNATQASDTTDVKVDQTSAAPAPTTGTVPFAEKDTLGKVMEMLNHSKYKLRTVDSIVEKADLDYRSDLFELLDENNIDYVTKTRRIDGELLIGLASRN